MGIRDWASKNRILVILVLFSLLMALIELYPVLGSGYSGDDSFESLTRGYMAEGHMNILTYTYYSAVGSAEQLGRSFVLQFYYFPVLSYASLHTYKLLIVLFVLLDLLSFGYFVRLISRSNELAVLAMLIVPLLFQLRLFHDPIMAYHMLQQVLLLVSIWSWIFLYYYLKNGRIRDLALSLALYGISMGIYEATYPFCIIAAALVFYYWRDLGLSKRLGVSALFATMTAIFICLSMAIRLYSRLPLFGGSMDYAYSINTNINAYVITLKNCLVAALPLSYFAYDPNVIFVRSPIAILGGVSLLAVIVFLGILVTFYLVSKKCAGDFAEKNQMGSPVLLLTIGILLWILPELLVSASYRYQQYIVPGLAYLPVYMSYFGVSLVAICLIWTAYDRVNKKHMTALIIIVGLLAAGIGSLNFMDNQRVVDFSNQYWLYPRSVVEDGLHHGLLDNVSVDSTLITGTNYPWDRSAFYLMGSGKELKYVASKSILQYMGFGKLDTSRLPAGSLANNTSGQYNFTGDDVYYLTYDSYAHDEGYAILGQVDHIDAPGGNVSNVTGRDFYVYTRTAYHVRPYVQQQIARYVTVSGAYANASGGVSEYFETGGDTIAGGDGWKLIHVVMPDGEVDFDSVSVKVST